MKRIVTMLPVQRERGLHALLAAGTHDVTIRTR